jgi:hypothetical protein
MELGDDQALDPRRDPMYRGTNAAGKCGAPRLPPFPLLPPHAQGYIPEERES